VSHTKREPGAHPPDVSIVVPTFNRAASVQRLLASFASQDIARERFEIVVVSDGSSDGTFELVRNGTWGSDVRPLEQRNRGRAAACNLGVQAARGGLVVFLDDDMQPVPAFVRAHLDAHRDAPALIGIGPVPVHLDSRSAPLVKFRAEVFDAKLKKLARADRPPAISDAYTGNASVSRERFLSVGGFDEGFRRYGHEDYELVRRLVGAGGAIALIPEAVAVQHYEKSFAQLARDIEDEGTTALYLMQRHPTAWPEVELSTWGRRSYRHRKTIEALIRAELRMGGVAKGLRGATRMLEWMTPSFLPRWYDLALDYSYWLGVVRAPGPVGEAFRVCGDLSVALEGLQHGTNA